MATGEFWALAELGDGNWWLKVRVPARARSFLVYKGSIAIDGISLTIASVQDGSGEGGDHSAHLRGHESWGRKAGDRVNIECDVLAKHVDKLLAHLK